MKRMLVKASGCYEAGKSRKAADLAHRGALWSDHVSGESMTPEIRRLGSALPSPLFDAIETQFTWVIKQTRQLLARAFSVQFAGNFAGTSRTAPVLARYRQGVGKPSGAPTRALPRAVADLVSR
jgi:hypothetical protein